MLERLTLKNFQCHESLDLDLNHPVVVLVGDSRSGKSAVLRALRWLVTNQPAGTAFISHGGSLCSVTLTFDGGRKVKRKRGRGVNSYHLGAARYVALGNGKVPDDIAQALTVDPVSVQRQHDPPFLLSLPPGQAAQALNQVVDLEVIDRALAMAGAEVRRSQVTVEVARERLSDARAERDRLGLVPEMVEEFTKIVNLQNNLDSLRVKTARIRSTLESRPETPPEENPPRTAAINAMVGVSKRLREVRGRLGALRGVLDSIRKFTDRVERLEVKVREGEDRVREALGETCPACGGKLPDLSCI